MLSYAPYNLNSQAFKGDLTEEVGVSLPPPHPPPTAPDTVTGGVTLSDPNTVCESTAEGSSCQGGLVGERLKRQLCQAEGPGGAPVAAG